MKLNFSQALTLFHAQLRLDLRNPMTGTRQSSRMVLTVVSFASSTLVLGLALLAQDVSPAQFGMVTMAFGVVLAAFGVTGSYDDLMGRPRDHIRSLSFPVSLTTHYVARILGILFFGAVMAFSAAAPVFLLGLFFNEGLFAVTTGLQMIAAMLATTLIVLAIIWGVILNVTPRIHKLLLSVARAVLIAAIVIGYQWLSMRPDMSIGMMSSQEAIAFAAGCLLVLVLLTVVYTLVFPGRYEDLLKATAALTSVGDNRLIKLAAPAQWERPFVPPGDVRAAFGISVAAFRSDRLIRGRVLPAAFMGLLFAAFGWWVGGLGDLFLFGAAELLSDTALQMHLSVMTILLFSSQVAMQGLRISDNPEAAWIYSASHSPDARAMQIGAQKALLFRILGPLHIIIGLILALSMPFTHAVAHSLFWFMGCALITRCQALIRPRFPMSERSDHFSAGQRFAPLLLAIPASILLATLQITTFTTVLSAFTLITGLAVIHWALGSYAIHVSLKGRKISETRELELPVLDTA